MSFGKLNLAGFAIGWLTVAACSAGSILAQDEAQKPASPATSEDSVRQELEAAIQKNPQLRGSWAVVVAEKDNPLRVVLVVDKDPETRARQEKLLREIVDPLVTQKIATLDAKSIEVPVVGLLSKIKAQEIKDGIENRGIAGSDDKANDIDGLDEVEVTDASFLPGSNEGQLHLKLNGSYPLLGVAKSDPNDASQMELPSQAELLRLRCTDVWLPELMGTDASKSIIINTDEPSTEAAKGLGGMVHKPIILPDLDELQRKLGEAIQARAELRNNLAMVVRHPQRRLYLQVLLIVDADPRIGSGQESLLRELVRSCTDSKYVTSDAVRVPLALFLSTIQMETEDDPGLAGIRVRDARYIAEKSTAQGVVLKLDGSCPVLNQTEDLRRVSEKWWTTLMGANPVINVTVDADPNTIQVGKETIGMVIRPSSRTASVECFQSGLDAFFKHDYPKALTLMTYALHDDPKRFDIKYWRVAVLIALNQKDRAQGIVTKLTPPDLLRIPYFSKEVLKSLEKLNGPLWMPIRMELDRMVRSSTSSPVNRPLTR